MDWPYKNIEQNKLEAAIKASEQIIVTLGGMLSAERMDNETWLMNKDDYITERVAKKVYSFRGSYVCVDKIYFPEKPFLVLEFADDIEGPYEDAEPFPYDLTSDEIKLEIEYALGVLPYPSWQEKAITEKMIPKYARMIDGMCLKFKRGM